MGLEKEGDDDGAAIILEGALNPRHRVSPREDDCYPWGRCRDPGQRGRFPSRPGCLRVVLSVFFVGLFGKECTTIFLPNPK